MEAKRPPLPRGESGRPEASLTKHGAGWEKRWRSVDQPLLKWTQTFIESLNLAKRAFCDVSGRTQTIFFSVTKQLVFMSSLVWFPRRYSVNEGKVAFRVFDVCDFRHIKAIFDSYAIKPEISCRGSFYPDGQKQAEGSFVASLSGSDGLLLRWSFSLR